MKMNAARYAELANMLAGQRASTMRERWDILWAHRFGPRWLAACYAEGLNDNHIDTGLRKFLGRAAS